MIDRHKLAELRSDLRTAQLTAIYVNAHLEKGARQVSPFDFVLDPEARDEKSRPGKQQTPAEQKAIFEAWAAAMNAPHAKPR